MHHENTNAWAGMHLQLKLGFPSWPVSLPTVQGWISVSNPVIKRTEMANPVPTETFCSQVLTWPYCFHPSVNPPTLTLSQEHYWKLLKIWWPFLKSFSAEGLNTTVADIEGEVQPLANEARLKIFGLPHLLLVMLKIAWSPNWISRSNSRPSETSGDQ